ncbi:MAG: NAD(P)H-hydrate dehydratase [Alphaproteobacteria bacterium]
MLELLSVQEMYAADRAAIDAGVSGETLMEAAGAGVAEAILDRFGPCPVAVLCGPGNNGGDGFVIARLLKQAGATVRLALLGEPGALKGDAAVMASRWDGAVEPLAEAALEGAELVVDAIFGAGLARDVDGPVRQLLEAAAARGLPSVAVDVPSGVHGDTGLVMGHALPAALTVTFFRAKPGHLLMPGRALCGDLKLIDIGIPADVLDADTWRNGPDLWLPSWPGPRQDGHKYSRGHVVVAAGPFGRGGAARLAARGALRIGAGLVTLAAPREAVNEHAGMLDAIMMEGGFIDAIEDARRNAVVVGPGNGITGQTRANALHALQAGKATVLDADALTVFADARSLLMDALHANCVLTPHEGEFARLFDVEGGKLARARAAAAQCGAVVLLKGPDTVIAAPDGRAIINDNAPPDLATAGAGDVLAGFIGGLLGQGVPAFEAAAAAAWLHGEAARAFGPGLIAEDLPEMLPAVLRQLRNRVS